jgi:hypothetical protein
VVAVRRTAKVNDLWTSRHNRRKVKTCEKGWAISPVLNCLLIAVKFIYEEHPDSTANHPKDCDLCGYRVHYFILGYECRFSCHCFVQLSFTPGEPGRLGLFLACRAASRPCAHSHSDGTLLPQDAIAEMTKQEILKESQTHENG